MANSHLNPVLLSAYIDDEVSAEERTLVESHLVICETCQVELDGLRWTANLFHQLPEMPLPRNFYITEAMLEEPVSSIKKSWLQWIQSLFDGAGAIPIGVGATVMALLLLMVIVQPFSTVSETQLAMAPLATAELPDQEVSALAMQPEEEALMNESDDFAMEDAEMSMEELSGEAAAMSEEELNEVISENDLFAEEESDAFLDTMPSVDEPEPQETAPAAPPLARRVGPTATIEQAEQTEQAEQAEQAVTAPSLTLMSTAELSSTVDSTETTDSTENSAVSQSPSPIASAPKESEPEQAAPPSESDLVSTESNQSAQTMLIVISILLLLIFGTIYWRKRSN